MMTPVVRILMRKRAKFSLGSIPSSIAQLFITHKAHIANHLLKLPKVFSLMLLFSPEITYSILKKVNQAISVNQSNLKKLKTHATFTFKSFPFGIFQNG
jgi:hypothetical protein